MKILPFCALFISVPHNYPFQYDKNTALIVRKLADPIRYDFVISFLMMPTGALP